MNLETLKNNYAQEQGYEDWENLIHSIINHVGINGRYAAIIAVEKHMDVICIRAQKAALEKAAENGLVRLNFNNLGDNNSISEKRFKIRDTAGFYDIDSDSITNPDNLIQ